MAVSISASQILLTLLFVLTLPWARGVRLVNGGNEPRIRVFARWAGATRLHRQPLTPPFLLLIGLTLLSAALSGDPGWSLWIARSTLLVATFYLVLWSTRDASHAARVWQGFLVALTIMAGYGLLQAGVCRARPPLGPNAWLHRLCTHPQRASGPFSIYMTFGGVLLLGALFFLAELGQVPSRRLWWRGPALGLTLAALAVTYARNAWLGLLAGILVLVATARRRGRLALGLVIIGLGALVLTPHAVMGRIRSITDLRDETVRDRVAMWRSGLAMVRDHPILGVGPGQVRAWYPQYRRPDAVRPSTGHLHNVPIQLAAERGLLALGAWVWLWVVFFRETGRILRRVGRDRPDERALVCASLAGVVGFLVAGLFEHNFGDAEVVTVVYALMTLPFIVERSLPLIALVSDPRGARLAIPTPAPTPPRAWPVLEHGSHDARWRRRLALVASRSG
jgi:O-antigen ligase